ncbi:MULTISPECIES: hypothetical protein [Halomonas]|uniref:DUF1640 domain-containing protein n=2 Tax=Halomonas TaxID=2745 RepID=W1NBE8_9GAMM|nr:MULTISPECIES: hypothetical protein [Halomonas]ALM54077.1 hypothetical protein AR456_18700 [Halomonas huangheensis]ERL52536.1 hypothetical protein BJB45_08260 [Halomonas huangheensis]GEN23093.1 hypothetical protein HCU01_10420 [Halomonas cupida]SHL79654.1 hypothetical protein SAMN05660971_01364 [Halomonas cupida]|tara:strand:+ start:111 stop:338 length:228 start_codon:yes stop_codon:yes gene_type:complete
MQLGIALYNALRSADVSDEKAMDVVNALESEMQQQLATKQDLSQLETRLTVRLGGMIAGSVGVLSIVMALLKVFS